MLYSPAQLQVNDPSLSIQIFDDLVSGDVNSQTNAFPFSAYTVRTIIGSGVVSRDTTNYGIAVLGDGLAVNNQAGLLINSLYHRFTNGPTVCEWRCGVGNTLSTAAEEYQFFCGISSSATLPFFANQVSNCGFYYDRLNKGNNWQCVCGQNLATRKYIDTGILVAIENRKFKFITNGDATNVDFFVDNVFVGSVANALPQGDGFVNCCMLKTAGTTVQHAMRVDYVNLFQTLNNIR